MEPIQKVLRDKDLRDWADYTPITEERVCQDWGLGMARGAELRLVGPHSLSFQIYTLLFQ